MKAEAIIYVNGCMTVEILDIEYGIEDHVKFRWGNTGHVARSLLRTTTGGRHYFISFGNKLFMDEAIKIN